MSVTLISFQIFNYCSAVSFMRKYITKLADISMVDFFHSEYQLRNTLLARECVQLTSAMISIHLVLSNKSTKTFGSCQKVLVWKDNQQSHEQVVTQAYASPLAPSLTGNPWHADSFPQPLLPSSHGSTSFSLSLLPFIRILVILNSGFFLLSWGFIFTSYICNNLIFKKGQFWGSRKTKNPK